MLSNVNRLSIFSQNNNLRETIHFAIVSYQTSLQGVCQQGTIGLLYKNGIINIATYSMLYLSFTNVFM